MNEIRIKRAYRAARESDGHRILVDRVWPRGVAKDRLRLSEWLKEIAPSGDLRRWFDHDPEKWAGFKKAYFEELAGNRESVSHILGLAKEGRVTLVYGAKDERHNNAAALKEYLDRHAAS